MSLVQGATLADQDLSSLWMLIPTLARLPIGQQILSRCVEPEALFVVISLLA